jgi:hypothetical protein
MTGLVAHLRTPIPAQGTSQPQVQDVIHAIESLPESTQAFALSSELRNHVGDQPAQVEFRTELMQGLGADRVGGMLAAAPQIDGIYSRGVAERAVLAAASTVYSPQEQGQLVHQLGAEQLSGLIAIGVYEAGRPDQDPAWTSQIRDELDGVAQLMGNVHGLPSGSAGRTEMQSALDSLTSGQEVLLNAIPGAEVAAWMVSRSDADALKLEFTSQYLAGFRQNPSFTATEARSVALVLGSMDPPSQSLAPIVTSLDHDQRKAFLARMMEASYGSTPEWETPALFRDDVVQGVVDFMNDVARLNPATFATPEAARDFRVQAFRVVTQGLDNDLFDGVQGMKDAVAAMFSADTAGIVHDLSESGNLNQDEEGRDLARFLDEVAFQNTGPSRQWVVDAMNRYLGLGSEQGVSDVLAANKGNAGFMAEQGNRLAREMGFFMGALYQGSEAALGEIQSEYERQKAVVDILGSIAATAIEASPVSAAYETIKNGTGGALEVEKVFDWLAEATLGQAADASKEGVTRLSDAIISKSWAVFFSDESLEGADSQELIALYSFINAGVALGDGKIDPYLRVGG